MLLESGHLVQIRIFVYLTFRDREESLPAGKDLIDPVSFFHLDDVIEFIFFSFCRTDIASHNRCIFIDDRFFVRLRS